MPSASAVRVPPPPPHVTQAVPPVACESNLFTAQPVYPPTSKIDIRPQPAIDHQGHNSVIFHTESPWDPLPSQELGTLWEIEDGSGSDGFDKGVNDSPLSRKQKRLEKKVVQRKKKTKADDIWNFFEEVNGENVCGLCE